MQHSKTIRKDSKVLIAKKSTKRVWLSFGRDILKCFPQSRFTIFILKDKPTHLIKHKSYVYHGKSPLTSYNCAISNQLRYSTRQSLREQPITIIPSLYITPPAGQQHVSRRLTRRGAPIMPPHIYDY